MKHTFAAEYAARVNAVKPADDFVSVPDFDAVRVTAFVQFRVRFDEIFRYPGSRFVTAFSFCTVFNHSAEIFINRKSKIRFLIFPA